MKNDEKISVSAYAKTIGVSKTAVQKAIKTGKLVKGYDSMMKKIIPSVAGAEYSFIKAATRLPKKIIENKVAGSAKPTIKKKAGKLSPTIPQAPSVAIISAAGDSVRIELSATDTFNEAMRKKVLIEGAIKNIELAEKQGSLLKRTDVDKAGYALATQVKKAFHNISARVMPAVRAAATIIEAENILKAEINSVLEILSTLQKIEIDDRN